MTTDQDTPPASDATPPSVGDGGAKAPATRIDRNEATIEEWRSRVLSNLSRTWMRVAAWAMLVLALVATSIAAVGGLDHVASVVVFACVAGVAAFGIRRMRLSDAAVRLYAALTPVTDPKTLGGEIAVVLAASDTMLKTFANPNATAALRRLSVLGVMSASQRIMARGGVTPETATVAGYPAWPEVDRTEMPGNPGDLQTFHLLRIDASAKRMARTADEAHGRSEVLLRETFATMAGEIVPPARALLAVVGDPDGVDDSA